MFVDVCNIVCHKEETKHESDLKHEMLNDLFVGLKHESLGLCEVQFCESYVFKFERDLSGT